MSNSKYSTGNVIHTISIICHTTLSEISIPLETCYIVWIAHSILASSCFMFTSAKLSIHNGASATSMNSNITIFISNQGL